jgi:hypothetical protein
MATASKPNGSLISLVLVQSRTAKLPEDPSHEPNWLVFRLVSYRGMSRRRPGAFTTPPPGRCRPLGHQPEHQSRAPRLGPTQSFRPSTNSSGELVDGKSAGQRTGPIPPAGTAVPGSAVNRQPANYRRSVRIRCDSTGLGAGGPADPREGWLGWSGPHGREVDTVGLKQPL